MEMGDAAAVAVVDVVEERESVDWSDRCSLVDWSEIVVLVIGIVYYIVIDRHRGCCCRRRRCRSCVVDLIRYPFLASSSHPPLWPFALVLLPSTLILLQLQYEPSPGPRPSSSFELIVVHPDFLDSSSVLPSSPAFPFLSVF